MFRFVSIAVRKLQAYKTSLKIIKTFNEWKKQQQALPQYTPVSNKLLLIRLDDIGDYILFRNFLGVYKQSLQWKNYNITLLGNDVWKELFEMNDLQTVNETIWINKSEYFLNETYRFKIWTQLRTAGFEVIICTSRTRVLLLDDLCATATAAKEKIAAHNLTYHAAWNKLSDSNYNRLFKPKNELLHEFIFNKAFTEWCCKTAVSSIQLDFPFVKSNYKSGIICFISASTHSKHWPVESWIEFIQLIQKKYSKKILIAGGRQDIEKANAIAEKTKAENITGTTLLKEIINLTGNSNAVISNDTMAAHAAVAMYVPTVIIANGNNYYRFTNYGNNFSNVVTIYPLVFAKKLQNSLMKNLREYVAVTADIATIQPQTVFKALEKLLQQ